LYITTIFLAYRAVVDCVFVKFDGFLSNRDGGRQTDLLMVAGGIRMALGSPNLRRGAWEFDKMREIT